ncbi:hypothetical protein B0J11DRAFT_539080 [Dendryphion nanum]|uniref:DUF2293 domain-containing protein n=1 Tax=Dendryphion nanum TaxID=256645 RepID=A0A9P9DBE8_9PLEO|nr:hypothetical protein B0J11DRAFT_539080 [Dendryphion nanum]
MARVSVNHHGFRQGAHGSSALDRTKAARKKKPYKVVMEVVTQEKKKLRSVMTYTANAPSGYTFVPLGNPDLTEYCKETCRRRNLTAHIVTAQPKKNAQTNRRNPQIDTQRIGYHFPNVVIEEACTILGYTWRKGQFIKIVNNSEETRIARNLRDYDERMRLDGRPLTERDTKDQIRNAIREVFPKIPEADMEGIVNHAFEEGSNRVGNAEGLSLSRRVQLAVGAFIRHQYTQYDTILKTTGSWPEARQRVQSSVYSKFKEWRDEADDKRELEETFRETIVIDDEDDEDSVTSDEQSLDGREPSLEIISSQATVRELQPESFIQCPRVSGDAVSVVPRRIIYLQPYSSAVGNSSNTYAHIPRQMTRLHNPPSLLSAGAAPQTPPEAEYIPSVRSAQPRPPAPKVVQDADGSWYNLKPITQSPRVPLGSEYISSSSSTPYLPRDSYRDPQHPAEQASYQLPIPKERLRAGLPLSQLTNSNVRYVQSPQRNNSIDAAYANRPSQLQPQSRASGSDVVLPSIEREPQPNSPRRYQNAPPDTDRVRIRPAMSRHQSVAESPKRKAFPASIYEVDDRHYEHVSKRVKPMDSFHMQRPDVPQYLHGHSPLDSHIRPRAPHPHETIDLTSSPLRPYETRKEMQLLPAPSYTLAVPGGQPYASAQPRVYSTRPHAYEDSYAVNERPRYVAEGNTYGYDRSRLH